MSTTNYDAIVIGVGSMGAAACYFLAKQGVRVLGLEQYDIPNALSSHWGQSRLTRRTYTGNPKYLQLLTEAHRNWDLLEEESGMQLYYKTGMLYLGPQDDVFLNEIQACGHANNIEVNELSADDLQKEYPQFDIPEHYKRLYEPDAGFIASERSVLAYTKCALQAGANIHTQERVLSWQKTGTTIEVKTAKAVYHCDRLILTAGPWASQLLPELSESLTITRQVIGWAIPQQWAPFELGTCPCWILNDEEGNGNYFGFPILPPGEFGKPLGIKIADHLKGATVHPDQMNRTPTQEEEDIFAGVLKRYMRGGYKSMHLMNACMYTRSPDTDFIIDFATEDKQVLVAAGFSGHGFKFASIVGKILADLALAGSTNSPIDFFSKKRLAKKSINIT